MKSLYKYTKAASFGISKERFDTYIKNYLSPRTIEIVNLYFNNGKSYKDIADTLGISVTCVSQHIVKFTSRITDNKLAILSKLSNTNVALVRGLSLRSRNILRRGGINDITELAKYTEAEILSIRNCGVHSMKEITSVMKKYGVSFRR